MKQKRGVGFIQHNAIPYKIGNKWYSYFNKNPFEVKND
jgi:hypothetical protein